jgi:hypothetical protein
MGLTSVELQLVERRKGNERYRAKEFAQAKYHYERAKSILDMVRGQGQAEQDEIDSNRYIEGCTLPADPRSPVVQTCGVRVSGLE